MDDADLRKGSKGFRRALVTPVVSSGHLFVHKVLLAGEAVETVDEDVQEYIVNGEKLDKMSRFSAWQCARYRVKRRCRFILASALEILSFSFFSISLANFLYSLFSCFREHIVDAA